MPGGPPASCMAPENPDAPTRTQFSLGAGWLDTTLDFGDPGRADVKMTAVSISASRPLGNRWTGRVSLGAVVDGTITPAGGAAHSVKPGGLMAVGAERNLRSSAGATPSVDLSGALGVTWAGTEDPVTGDTASYFAADLRFGARAGWQLGTAVYPYVAGRLFGGPVKWDPYGEDLTGADIHHYQLAVGAAVVLGKVAVFGEWAGVGERGVSLGAGTAW